MTYQCVLLAVQDLAYSKRFYCELFGLRVTADFGANITLSDCIALQTRDTWAAFLHKSEEAILLRNHAIELYFETEDIAAFLKQLEAWKPTYINELSAQPWGQQAVRFYDPDGHVIEVGETLHGVVARFLAEGLSEEETAVRMDIPLENVRALALYAKNAAAAQD